MPVVPSTRFDRALHGPLSGLEEEIIECIIRISSNPYEPELVEHCQVGEGEFAYHSPVGFELYWDVEVKATTQPFPAGMRILLTELRPLRYTHVPAFWLDPNIY